MLTLLLTLLLAPATEVAHDPHAAALAQAEVTEEVIEAAREQLDPIELSGLRAMLARELFLLGEDNRARRVARAAKCEKFAFMEAYALASVDLVDEAAAVDLGPAAAYAEGMVPYIAAESLTLRQDDDAAAKRLAELEATGGGLFFDPYALRTALGLPSDNVTAPGSAAWLLLLRGDREGYEREADLALAEGASVEQAAELPDACAVANDAARLQQLDQRLDDESVRFEIDVARLRLAVAGGEDAILLRERISSSAERLDEPAELLIGWADAAGAADEAMADDPNYQIGRLRGLTELWLMSRG